MYASAYLPRFYEKLNSIREVYSCVYIFGCVSVCVYICMYNLLSSQPLVVIVTVMSSFSGGGGLATTVSVAISFSKTLYISCENSTTIPVLGGREGEREGGMEGGREERGREGEREGGRGEGEREGVSE